MTAPPTVGTCCLCGATGVPVTNLGVTEQATGPGRPIVACKTCAPALLRLMNPASR